MSISMDHDCTPYCPDCISEEDLLKFLTTREIAPKPTSYKSSSLATVRLVCLIFAIVALLSYCCLPDAQIRKSQEATGYPTERQTSIGLAEMLEVIEYVSKDISQSSTDLAERLEVLEALSKDVRFSLTESAHIMAAKGSCTSTASCSPNHRPSLSRDNHDSAPSASWSERQKKPDGASKPHPTGRGFPLLNKLCKAIRRSIATLLSVGLDGLSMGLSILLSMTALNLALSPLLGLTPGIQTPVTTGSSTDRQFSPRSAERLELSEPRRTDRASSEIIEAAQDLLKLSTESAQRLEVSESRRADVPSSQIEVAHLMVTHEGGTSATDYPNPGPSPSPDNHDSPLDVWHVWEVIEREEA